ncbi:hypothetical protein FQZ97_791920 [compost metagenome]
MAVEVSPSRRALSRSTLATVSTPFWSWSVSMSVSVGCCFISSASFTAQVRRSDRLSLLSVYW